jgi:hypothetical protein
MSPPENLLSMLSVVDVEFVERVLQPSQRSAASGMGSDPHVERGEVPTVSICIFVSYKEKARLIASGWGSGRHQGGDQEGVRGDQEDVPGALDVR